MLYGGEVIAAKKLIDEGYLGKIYHARSYGYRRRGRPYVDGYGEREFDSSQWAATAPCTTWASITSPSFSTCWVVLPWTG